MTGINNECHSFQRDAEPTRKDQEKKTHDRLVKINIEDTVTRFLRMGRNKARQ